jgi:hypothetical protein
MGQAARPCKRLAPVSSLAPDLIASPPTSTPLHSTPLHLPLSLNLCVNSQPACLWTASAAARCWPLGAPSSSLAWRPWPCCLRVGGWWWWWGVRRNGGPGGNRSWRRVTAESGKVKEHSHSHSNAATCCQACDPLAKTTPGHTLPSLWAVYLPGTVAAPPPPAGLLPVVVALMCVNRAALSCTLQPLAVTGAVLRHYRRARVHRAGLSWLLPQ